MADGSHERRWLLERLTDAAVSVSTTGSVVFANRAAHSLATRLNPGNPDVANLVAMVPTSAVAGARDEGVWKGVTELPDLGLVLDLELQMTSHGSIAIFRHRGFESDHAAQSEAHLRHADRLSTLGQLAAGVAHEVNNPLSYAQSNLRVLEEYAASLHQAYEAAATVIRATGNAEAIALLDRQSEEFDVAYITKDLPKLLTESRSGLQSVGSLMADLRGFAREGSSKMEEADLIAAVESSLSIVNSFIKFKAEVRRDMGPVPPVECRVEQIKQVIVNLLMNSAQAISGYGTITVAAGATEGEAWISVQDTGAGIPTEKLARIFDPYYTTKPVGEGTGIGLAICYGIIASHRGRIEVRSRVGEGTFFRIVLPIRQPAPAETRTLSS